MSYSFSVTGASKADAIVKVGAEFAQIAVNQPTHAKDKDAAVAVPKAFVDLLADPTESEVIYVTMWGSLGWRGESDAAIFTSGSVSVDASVRSKA
jgi:hypothetical protein